MCESQASRMLHDFCWLIPHAQEEGGVDHDFIMLFFHPLPVLPRNPPEQEEWKGRVVKGTSSENGC